MGSDPIDSIFFGGEFSKVVRWEEFRLYHRKDGKVVKEGDDLLCATRYGLMMLRYAKTKSFSDKWRREISYPNLGILAPGQDAYLLACRLIRQRRNSGAPRGFNDRIIYPKLRY